MAGDYNGFRAEKVEDSKGYYDVIYDPVTRREVEVTGPLEIAQACELRLRLWQTGWILDREHGFPWFRFLGQKFDPRLPTERAFLDGWVRYVAQKDPRLKRVRTVTMDLDKNRHLVLALEGETMNDEELTVRIRTPLA
jgi:hypothetical protein